MKTKALSRFLYPILALILVSFSDPYTIKRISDANFRYEFYTTDRIVKTKVNKVYYWFKGGAIHNSQAGISGVLLNDKFIKMYHSNQLAEQGEFENGLKVGLWNTWYPNGMIQTTQNWSDGLRSGAYYRYNENGELAEKGNFKTNLRNGRWVDFEKKDTVVYKKGLVFIKKQKLSKIENFKLKQDNNKVSEAKKALKESEELNNAATLVTYKAAAKESKKVVKENKKAAKKIEKAKKVAKGDSKIKAFFKKVFGKKQPN